MALRAMGGPLLACAMVVALAVGAVAAEDARTKDEPRIEVDVFLMSDYIYRGVSLSERKPSAAAAIEAEWHGFYANTNVQSVVLPTNPAGEITLTGGYRWKPTDFVLDWSAIYFWYPGETLSEGAASTSYWEYAFNIEHTLLKDAANNELVTLKGQLAYAPNVSGTGAWGAYSEARVEIDLSRWPLLPGLEWQLNASAGYWLFGDTSPVVGGFPLPAYANWLVGLEFTFKDHFVVDLSYVDTNLSKEDCFVFTGDTMATAGGAVNPITNPGGLRSRLCGPAVVASFSVQFEDLNSKD